MTTPTQKLSDAPASPSGWTTSPASGSRAAACQASSTPRTWWA
ncbi:hypothetical protein QJS66_02970 [Kocuria rhizophila]|nr:hypothetical protein QJS66_02970 [Kocuria rhizophila]